MNNSRMIHGPASRADGDEPGTPGWYRPAKETKRGETGGRESQGPIVPSKRGNRPEGPRERKGCRLRNRRRETCQVHRDLIHGHVTTTDCAR